MSLFNNIRDKVSELTQPERDDVERRLAHPDMRPGNFDGTLEAWLVRIGIWGKISITLNDPENGIKNKTITNDQFLDIVDDKEDNRVFGLWEIKKKEVNYLVFYRKYVAYNGRTYTKEMHIKVKLKSNLQKALDNAKKKSIFGWFLK